MVRVRLSGGLALIGVLGQVTADATLTGVVNDASGAVISDAQVRLESIDTRAIRETRMNGEGAYRFDLVAPGAYKVTISASGFQTKVINGVILAVGQTVTNNATLAIGQQTQTIMVEASSPLINVEKTDISTTVTPHEVENLPLELIAQAFNLTNRANYGNDYNNDISDPTTFGHPQGFIAPGSTIIPRSLWSEFGVRFSF